MNYTNESLEIRARLILHKYFELLKMKWKEVPNSNIKNGNDVCDTLSGPCSCGSWHKKENENIPSIDLQMYSVKVDVKERKLKINL